MKAFMPFQALFFPGFAARPRCVRRLAADCLWYFPPVNDPPLDDPRPDFWGCAKSSYTADHSASEGTNASGSRSIASLIAVSSLFEFLRTVNFREIAINLPIVGFPQTYDAQSRFANRKYHSRKSISDQRVGKNSTLGIVATQIWHVTCALPVQIISGLKIDTMKPGVRDAFCLIPLANQHTKTLCPNFNQEVYP